MARSSSSTGTVNATSRARATAGSGKTPLALQLLETAAAERLNACYVCYNRSLAEGRGGQLP